MARIDFEKDHQKRDRQIQEQAEGRLSPEKKGEAARRLLRQARAKRDGVISHIVVYLMVVGMILFLGGVTPAGAVAFGWGIGIFFSVFGYFRWMADKSFELRAAERDAALLPDASPPSLPPVSLSSPGGAELSGVASELLARCQAEAQEVDRLVQGVASTDAGRAAEVEATVRAGMARIRDLLIHRHQMDRLLAARDQASLDKEREELLQRMAGTADPGTLAVYQQSLDHLDTASEGLRDLRTTAERIEAKARAYADALKVMQVDLMRLQAATGLDEPTAALEQVAHRAERLTAEVQSVRDVMEEVAQARRQKQGS